MFSSLSLLSLSLSLFSVLYSSVTVSIPFLFSFLCSHSLLVFSLVYPSVIGPFGARSLHESNGNTEVLDLRGGDESSYEYTMRERERERERSHESHEYSLLN